jgi:hypothetical protein
LFFGKNASIQVTCRLAVRGFKRFMRKSTLRIKTEC